MRSRTSASYTDRDPPYHRLTEQLCDMADLYAEQGKLTEAEDVYSGVFLIQSESANLPLPVFADAGERYAHLCVATGRNDDALQSCQKSFAIRLRNFSDGVQVMSERDALTYQRVLHRSRDDLLSVFVRSIYIQARHECTRLP